MKNPLVDYIETHENWQEELSQAPYSIKIKTDGQGYWCFSYHLFESDFYNSVVKHSRGTILYIDWPTVEIICWPFNKFHNYGEGPADKIDWRTARALEKIDGSLIKGFYRDSKWRFATNNGLDANAELPGFTPVCNEPETATAKTFQDLIDYALRDKQIPFDELDTDFCFMFELVSPRNRIVVPYDKTELYVIGCRKMDTGDEWPFEIANELLGGRFKTPKVLEAKDIEAALKLTDNLDANQEGFVVTDHLFNRVKLKGKAYLVMHHLKGEKQFTWDHLFECVINGTSDDAAAYFTELSPQIKFIEQEYSKLEKLVRKELLTCLHKWQSLDGYATQAKEYAEYVMQHYSWMSNAAFNVKKMPIDQVYELFKEKLDYAKFENMTHVEEWYAQRLSGQCDTNG